MTRLSFFLLMLGTLLLVAAATVHADDPIAGKIVDVDDSNFPEIKAIVTVIDPSGRPVTDLGVEAFAVEETGAQGSVVRLETVLDQQVGIAVILALDTSGSMAGQALTESKTAAAAFLRSLQPVDQAAVLSFADQVVVRDGLTSDRGTSVGAVDQLAAGGNTALFTAVTESVNLARTASLPRTAIILLSDGLDFGGASTATRGEALALASEANIPIYAVGLGSGIDRAFLEDLSRRTGGAFLEAPEPSSIPALYDQLSQLLRSQYVLTVRSTAPPDITDRSLRLTVTAAAGSTEAIIAYKTRRVVAVSTPLPIAPATSAAPQTGEGGGNNFASYVLLAGIATAAALGSGAFAHSRLRDRRMAMEIAAQSEKAVGEMAAIGEGPPATSSQDVLLQIEGPNGSSQFRVTREPAMIGRALSSQLRLKDGEGVADEHARIWSMDGKLIFHHLAAGYSSTVNGETASWVSLNSGDELQVGPYRLRVESA